VSCCCGIIFTLRRYAFFLYAPPNQSESLCISLVTPYTPEFFISHVLVQNEHTHNFFLSKMYKIINIYSRSCAYFYFWFSTSVSTAMCTSAMSQRHSRHTDTPHASRASHWLLLCLTTHSAPALLHTSTCLATRLSSPREVAPRGLSVLC